MINSAGMSSVKIKICVKSIAMQYLYYEENAQS
jgi:hypothetical protein